MHHRNFCGPNLFIAFTVAMFAVAFQATTITAQDQQDPPAAVSLAQTAVNAQNAQDYQVAVDQWQRLLKDFPDTTLTGLAHYNSGVCYQALTEYPRAIEQLKLAITKLDKAEVLKLAQAHLYLGFCELRHGKDLLGNGDSQTRELASQSLTTATQTFANLANRYPDYEDLDQAYFFQGESFELLNRLEKATESYAKMLECKKITFQFDGLFALANVHEKLGNFDTALKFYDQFHQLASDQGGHPLLSEVEFRTAETHLQLAVSAENLNDQETARSHYRQADELYGSAAADAKFELRDRAKFQQGYCANRLGDFERSAALYTEVARQNGDDLGSRALVYAGRDLLNAKQTNDAIQLLTEAVQKNSSYSPEAAHWLAQIYLQTKQFDEALRLATAWIEKTPASNPIRVSLMLDQGDAAYMIPDQRAESVSMYLAIVDNYGDHSLAPTALYNAAYSNLDVGDYEQAIALVDRFIQNYENNDYLSDALEVKADASLLAGNPAAAEETFTRLINRNGQSPKVPIWNVRTGMSRYLQKNFEGAVEWLSPKVESLADASLRAEALHWLGKSLLELDRTEDAITALNNSHSTDPKWRRADETLSSLALAQKKAGQLAEAVATTKQLIDQFPQSKLLDRAFLSLGEIAYDAKEFEAAESHYQAIVTNFGKSEVVPYALDGLAWSLVQQKKFADAVRSFNQLIDDWPENELAKRARIGRGASRRQSGDPQGAIDDLNTFLADQPEGQPQIDAMYELGLAQIDLKQWEDAQKTFASLIDTAPDSRLADRFHYELAWSLKSLDRSELAVEQFGKITQQFPESPLAPEASFHVGNAAFDSEKYDLAIPAYQFCATAEKSSNSLREKAKHQLGRAYFKQSKYEDAYKAFAEQVAEFPQGEFLADGQMMVSESLMRLKRYDMAYEAYRVAKPAIENASPKNRFLSLLHGGQSANQIKKFQEALEFVQPIIASDEADESFKQDAYLEAGTAYSGLRDKDRAVEAWEQAAKSLGKTGARARCMLGDQLFAEQKFEDAINQFKLVLYGFGGLKSDESIKPWQAYAAYEAARCNYVRIQSTDDAAAKAKLVEEASRHFSYLVEHFPNDQHAKQARDALANLAKLKSD